MSSLLKFSNAKSRLEREMFELESTLLDPTKRRAADQIDSVLHPDFSEIGSSGSVYDRAAMIEMMTQGAASSVLIRDFDFDQVAADVVLNTYRTVAQSGKEVKRSSLWIHHEDRWRLRFHQGTPTPDSWGRVG